MRADAIFACALAALPEAAANGDLPDSLQVFPPGQAVKFTLQDYPGEQFEMDVTPEVAAKANSDLQALIAKANAGEAPVPFADKNHEDGEATLTPLEYFWGGSDKKTGGVRLKVAWNNFGAALVRSKAFKYFSQNFLFSKTHKKFVGLINENIGGLVNRPGFATQAAFARADLRHVTVPSPSTDIETMNTDQLNELGAAIGSAISQALAPIAQQLAGNTRPARASAAVGQPSPSAVKEFTDIVRAQAKANGGDLIAALSEATLSHPAEAEEYLMAMRARRR